METAKPIGPNNFALIRLFAVFQIILTFFNFRFGWDTGVVFFLTRNFFAHFPGIRILFFVSGYLVFASYLRNPESWKETLRRRLFRIYPAMWVCVGLTIVFVILTQPGHGHSLVDWVTFIATQSTILQGYVPESFMLFPTGEPNSALWAVGVLVQFYFLVPVVAKTVNRLDTRSVATLFAVLIYSSYLIWAKGHGYFPELYAILKLTFIPYLQYFLLGIAAFWFRDKYQHKLESKALIWVGVYLLFQLFIEPLLYPILGYFWIQPFNWFLMYGTILSLAYSSKNLSAKILRGNRYAYGLYIYYALVFNAVFILMPDSTMPWIILLTLLVSIVMAFLSWHIVEKNFHEKTGLQADRSRYKLK